MIGGLAGFMVGDRIVSGAVQEHYADVERIGGVTRELGDIMGGGRGFNREKRYRMGAAVRKAASDLNMDVQVMADVMSGARKMGMLPSTTDPGKLREKARGLAEAIDNAAQLLGTSMGNAMGVIKGMTGLGFGARGGVEKLVSMGAAAGVSPLAMYGAGMQGAGIANRIEMNRRSGFDLFTQGIISAAGGGLNRSELGYVGGVTGLGRQIATAQMRHAISPRGDMQLMAMAGGEALPADLFATASMAMRTMSKGGDPMGNMIQFTVHRREMREKLGAKGMQMMFRQSIMGEAKAMGTVSPNTSEEEWFRFIAMGRGMSSTAAMGMYRGTMGGGGGAGGGGGGGVGVGGAPTSLAEAQYNAFVGTTMRRYTSQLDRLGLKTIKGRIIQKAKDAIDIDSGYKGALIGGGLGYAIGKAPGAMVGATLGFLGGKVYDFLGQGGLSLDMDAVDQSDREFLRNAKRTDRLEERVRRRHGLLPFDRGAYTRLSRGKVDLDSLSLDMGTADPYGFIQSRIASQLAFAGIKPVGRGPGTIKIGGEYWRSADVNRGGGLDQTMSNRYVDKAAVAGATGWMIGIANERSEVGEGLKKAWGRVM
ncbi:hypothetical protein LCGC14_2171220, partial [marine sediment metagenome]